MKAVLLLLTMAIASAQSYAVVIFDDFRQITQSGQYRAISTSLASISGYNTITLDIFAKGDFGTGSDERISFDVNDHSVFRAQHAGITEQSDYDRFIESRSFNSVRVRSGVDYEMTISLVLDVAALLSDTDIFHGNVLTIDWITNNAVNPFNSGGRDYVRTTLTGTNVAGVPEPGTIGLLGMAFLALGLARRKRTA